MLGSFVTLPVADKRTQEGKKTKGNESDNSDTRPKKVPPRARRAKPSPKANGKVSRKFKGKR